MDHTKLTTYHTFILNRIIGSFKTEADFNIYELISESVSNKCILPSQNELVMDSYYFITEFLLNNGFVIENKEMTSYALTSKGIELKNCGNIQKYDAYLRKKLKGNIFKRLFSKNQQEQRHINESENYYE